MRSPLSWVALCGAGVLFLLGLLAPLTPSEGNPQPLAVALFIVLPLALCLGSLIWAQRRGPKYVAVALALLVGATTAWLYLSVL